MLFHIDGGHIFFVLVFSSQYFQLFENFRSY